MSRNPSAEGYRTPTISYMRPHHRTMARMLVSGATQTEVCKALGFTAGHMTRIVASPAFQAIMRNLEEQADDDAVDLKGQLEAMQMRALEVLDEDLEIECESLKHRRLRQQAARDVLDRTMGRKTSAEGGTHLHLHDHKELKVSMREKSTEELMQNVLDIVVDDT